MTTTDDDRTIPSPQPPRRTPSVLITMTGTLLFIAMLDAAAVSLWPCTEHWIGLAVAVLVPLIVQIITEIHNRRS